MGPVNTHKCTESPLEAAIYSLKAEGKSIKKFRAMSRTELTLDVEDTFGQKKRPYSLKCPINFSRKDASMEHDDMSHIEEVEG